MVRRLLNRTEAGRLLASKLTNYANRGDVLVLGLPRGGVPVAYEVALALNAPLDVCLVRKLGVPGRSELAMGAIASGGIRVLNSEIVAGLAIPESVIETVAAQERQELERRERAYRGSRSAPEVGGKTVILVDDGIATGATLRAAVAALRSSGPDHLVVAVPVAPPATCSRLEAEVDEVVCLMTPEPFWSIGLWYEDFSQTTDAEVRELLARGQPAAAGPSKPRSNL